MASPSSVQVTADCDRDVRPPNDRTSAELKEALRRPELPELLQMVPVSPDDPKMREPASRRHKLQRHRRRVAVRATQWTTSTAVNVKTVTGRSARNSTPRYPGAARHHRRITRSSSGRRPAVERYHEDGTIATRIGNYSSRTTAVRQNENLLTRGSGTFDAAGDGGPIRANKAGSSAATAGSSAKTTSRRSTPTGERPCTSRIRVREGDGRPCAQYPELHY